MPDKDLAPADSPIQIKYVPIDSAVFFSENVKRHSIGDIAKSIAKNGFRNPPLWDSNLNGGTGGIVAGNGRTEALQWMKKQGQDAPKGIAVDDDGQWFMPIVFGCDADSEAAAKAFSIDDNSLTMSGSDFTALDMSRLYDQQAYLDMLLELNEQNSLPLTVDEDDLELLLRQLNGDDPGVEQIDQIGQDETGLLKEQYQVLVSCSDEMAQAELLERLTNEGYQCKSLIS